MNRPYKVKCGLSSTKEGKEDPTVKLNTSDIAKVKFEIYGEEMIEKVVKSSGNSGRVYLPPNWVGCHVKVIRVN